MLPNLGTATAPNYGSGAIADIYATINGNSTVGVAIDGSGNAWQTSSGGLNELQGTGSPITAVTDTVYTAALGTPNFDIVDGLGSVWTAANGTATEAVSQYVIGTGAASNYTPCYLTTGATTCVNSINTPQRTIVDSTGSVWVTSLANGHLIQLMGPGSPTWPQLSYGNPGVEPQ